MPYVHIDWVKGHSPEKRDEIAKRVTHAISDVTGIGLKDIWVVFKTVEADEWYVGDESVRKIRSGVKG